jgi:hypothetical protein
MIGYDIWQEKYSTNTPVSTVESRMTYMYINSGSLCELKKWKRVTQTLLTGCKNSYKKLNRY